MVLGFATLAGRAGLGMLTGFGSGLGMGIGYGYGVRLGYNMYSPSKNKTTNQLHTSLNPLEGSVGAGLLTAEEVTDKQASRAGLTTPEQLVPEVQTPHTEDVQYKHEKFYDSKDGSLSLPKSAIYSKARSVGITDKRDAFRRFANREYPFNNMYQHKKLNRR